MRDTTTFLKIKRKCSCCENEVYINKNNICDYIYYDKKLIIVNVLQNFVKKRINNKRIDISTKWTQIYDGIERIEKESYSHFMSSLFKEDIFNFIKDAYDVTIIPTTVWQKIADINNGSYKGMCGNGIPLEHLLDMWKRKIGLLNNINSKNITKGIVIQPQQRLSYDLSILINKYDSYLKWLEKKRINDIENETIKSDKLIVKIGVSNITKDTSCNEDDISNLVDDIFG